MEVGVRTSPPIRRTKRFARDGCPCLGKRPRGRGRPAGVWFKQSWRERGGAGKGDRRRGTAGRTRDPNARGRGRQGAGPGGGRGIGRRGCIAAAAGVLAGGRRARSGAASRLCDGPKAMAASLGPAGVGGAGPSGFAFDSGLEIKTRSVEQTLLPLVSQVKWRPEPPLLSLRPRRPAMAPAACTAREAGSGPAGGSRCPTFHTGTAASSQAARLRLGGRPRPRRCWSGPPEIRREAEWAEGRGAQRGP